jgi:hypothetical protein
MKKEYIKLRPFPDIQPGKGRSAFLGNGCDYKNEYTLPSPDMPVRSFLGALVCSFFAIQNPSQADC